jgi:colanic acid/amylovoran biosynthesis glycosyltransferase
VDDCEVAGQTFVHRHIRELFGGSTVIVCRKPPRSEVQPKPHFVYERMRLNPKMLLRHGLRVFDDCNLRALEKFFRDNQVEYVLAEFGYAGLAIYREASRFRIPMFCYFRGADASRWLTSRKYARRLRDMMPNLFGIFAVSDFLVQNLARHGITHPNTRVIPSGVDTDYFAPAEKNPNRLSSVGRFVPKKGHLISIQAFHEVSSEFSDIKFELVGDGEELARCKAYVQDAGIGDRVIFHGEKNHAFVRDLLATSPVYIQHSLTTDQGETEGMPSSIQEAMACGNAVLTTRHAGIPEHVSDSVNGFLVSEFDKENYVAKLRAVLKDHLLRQRMASAAREYAVRNLDYRLSHKTIEQAFRDSQKCNSRKQQ